MTRSARTVRHPCLSSGLAVLAAMSGPLFAATATSPVASAAAAPGKDSFIGEMLAILLPMVFIIVALVFLLRMLRRRYGLAGRDSPLTVLQILPVGPRERVVLLQSRAGRTFAIGVAAQNVTFITDLDLEDVASAPETGADVASHASTNILSRR